MNCFYASAERAFNPSLEGKPVIVLTDYVPRNIIGVLLPGWLCGPVRESGVWSVGFGRLQGHIIFIGLRASSEGFRRIARRGWGGVPLKRRTVRLLAGLPVWFWC